jgi:hypothetical protein
MPHPFAMVRATHNLPYCALNINLTASPRRPTCLRLYTIVSPSPHPCRPHLNSNNPHVQPSLNLSISLELHLPHSLYLQCREQCVRLFIYRLGSVETKLVPSSGELRDPWTAGLSANDTGRSSLRSMVSRPTVPTRVPPICSWSESTSTTTRLLPTSMCPEPSSSIWSQEPWTLSEVDL